MALTFPATTSCELCTHNEFVSCHAQSVNNSKQHLSYLHTSKLLCVHIGLQLVAIEGLYGEPLPLAVPLPLGRRPAPQWLRALEGALSYSLASRLTECLTTFPEGLMGIKPEQQGESTSFQTSYCKSSECCIINNQLPNIASFITGFQILHHFITGFQILHL